MFTPNEIRRIEFSKAMSGYKKQEVDEFLYDISKDYESLFSKLDKYRDRVEELEERIKEYEEKEKSINEAILTAQKMSHETLDEVKKRTIALKSEAEEKAKGIIENARAKADEMVSLAEAQSKQIIDDANKKSDDMMYSTRMRLQSEEKKLTVMKHLVTDFKDEIIEKYKEHIQMFLDTYKSAKTIFEQPDFPKAEDEGQQATEAEVEPKAEVEAVAETDDISTDSDDKKILTLHADDGEDENPQQSESEEKTAEANNGFSIDMSALDDEQDDWSSDSSDVDNGDSDTEADDGMSNREPPLSFFPGMKSTEDEKNDNDNEDFRILWDEDDDQE